MVEAVSTNLPPIAPSTERAALTPSLQDGAQAAPQQPAPATPKGSKSNEFDNKTLDKIAERLVSSDARLAISQDDFISRFIYKFVDQSSGDVINQYPHERVVQSLHAMEESRERFLDRVA